MSGTILSNSLTAQEIVDLTKRHTLFEWSSQASVDPIPVAGAKGSYFWTPDGRRFLDFNSQPMWLKRRNRDSPDHGTDQGTAGAAGLRNPFMATEPRAR